uniref:VLIG-type G domain-containing protein n=1 Tax=Cyprinodon variegatus TaxID=28743 RepID=A0A3Q2D8I7_CYPVA
ERTKSRMLFSPLPISQECIRADLSVLDIDSCPSMHCDSSSFQVSAHRAQSISSSTVVKSSEVERTSALRLRNEEYRKKYHHDFESLLRRLQLQDQHQQMLSSEDFFKVGPPVKQTEIYEKDKVCMFFQRLLTLDYRARYIHIQQKNPNGKTSQSILRSGSAVTDENDLAALFTTSVELNQSNESHVHPMDLQMAAFRCSDSFLKQKMITKLSQCQYALPLLIPDPVTTNIEFPLWTFRQITKTWKRVTMGYNTTTVTMKSMPIYKAETPMVSFFRLGSVSSSKSQLMNALINDRHHTFFHRNCPGSTKSRYLMDGVAEIAWYCPAGKPNDFFTDCIAFCNLHGDSLKTIKQRELLTEKSSVIAVLVESLEKGQESIEVISELYKSPKPLIILIADNGCSAVEMKPQKYKLGLKERSQSDVSEELKDIIQTILSGALTAFQLETLASDPRVTADEDTEVCRNGKSAAMKLVKLVEGMNISKVKDTFLPCQGQLWYEWCKINKESYNLKVDIEKERSQKIQQLIELRQKQCDLSNSELVKSFTESLRRLPPKDREYFLKWTQILIDKSLELKKKHDKSANFNLKQDDLNQLSKKLQSATFGLEHIFREMGQIYEAHKSLEKPSPGQQAEWTKYPELAADLMIKGHPMELMDGDAGHVPLIWVSSLIQEVIKKLGDQRVFVLSVLGVQSSGKSTMLNAMFGLQFAVSAGRCTKGAYMQLVKLSDEIQNDYKFDYILVVDTEGLRALELAGNATLHDNELATFVVGLGNMTLINIFGENPAEMQDVLQIVVQALMRMKKVKLSPSCVFVHQNVTDIAAAEKNMDGKRRLQETLDKMAQLAAKEEVCDAECFSDVIAFDVQKDVKYFAQLWEGSPPMAPPNPGYSESVQELKTIILSKAKPFDGILLSHFNAKIQDLWNALMNENFVFSFKNTQEIAVYRKLEVEYGNWTWTLRSEMLNIENQLYPKIEKGQLDKVELSYLYKEISKTYKAVTDSLGAYFDNDKDKEMLVQWKGRFENKIKEFNEELVRAVKRKLEDVIQQNTARIKLEKKKTEFQNQLFQKSKELATILKSLAEDEEELKEQFNTVWIHWVKELTSDAKPIEDIHLEEDELVVLQDLGLESRLIDESKNRKTYIYLSERGNYSCYTTKKKSRLSNLLQPAQEKFESGRKYTFKKEFIADLSLYAFDRAESWLLDSHKKFKENNDVSTYLESKKKEYYNIFRGFCKGSSSVVLFGEMMCEKLKVSAIEAVCNKTGVDIAGEMRCNYPAFSENRLNLEKHVLASLAEKEDFSRFISYIRNPKKQVKAFIKEEVYKYMFTTHKSKAQTILRKNVEDIYKIISHALFKATEKLEKEQGEIKDWLEEFFSVLGRNLTLETINCQNFSDIKNFDFLKEEMEKGLKIITVEMNSLPLEKVKECRQKPEQILIDQLCNCCWVRCPFCAAVCTNTLKDHSPEKHSVPFHRPSGVKGWHVRGKVDLVVDFCTTLVASDKRFYPELDSEQTVPYKQYPTAGEKYASWSITADASKLAYWKWFVCHFQEELENHYKLKFQGWGKIPQEWKHLSKEKHFNGRLSGRKKKCPKVDEHWIGCRRVL